jgi:hypothetical protein
MPLMGFTFLEHITHQDYTLWGKGGNCPFFPLMTEVIPPFIIKKQTKMETKSKRNTLKEIITLLESTNIGETFEVQLKQGIFRFRREEI